MIVPPPTPQTPPSAPVITLVANNGANVVVAWTAPSSVSPILNYTILIQCASGSWTQYYCHATNATTNATIDATTNATTFATTNTSCLIP